jgi:hypothetical protein
MNINGSRSERRPKRTSQDSEGPQFWDNVNPEVVSEVLNVHPHKVLEEPKSDVFDKLSKTLATHATQLRGDDAKREHRLRTKVVASLKHYSTNHIALGSALTEYKTVYKSKGQWTRVAKEIGTAIGCSERTIFRMIDGYEASLKPVHETNAAINLAAVNGDALSKQDRRERNARIAIRSFLNNFPDAEKLKALAGILAEEAHQVWGKKRKFSIDVIPHTSRLTIDGRKKRIQKASEASAA